MLTDPIADLITRLRNGYAAGHKEVKVPFSKLKVLVAEVLKREGYINAFAEEGAKGPPKQHMMTMVLRYDERREPVLREIKRMSSPGVRRYYSCDEIPRVKGGLGIVIVSTSKGLMTDREARRGRHGGEAMCSVW